MCRFWKASSTKNLIFPYFWWIHFYFCYVSIQDFRNWIKNYWHYNYNLIQKQHWKKMLIYQELTPQHVTLKLALIKRDPSKNYPDKNVCIYRSKCNTGNTDKYWLSCDRNSIWSKYCNNCRWTPTTFLERLLFFTNVSEWSPGVLILAKLELFKVWGMNTNHPGGKMI